MEGAGWSRVTHPFATVCAPEGALPVRLACVKHAASVHPEPGSNSPLKKRAGISPLPWFHEISLVLKSLVSKTRMESRGRQASGFFVMSSDFILPVHSIRFSRCPASLSGAFVAAACGARKYITPLPIPCQREIGGILKNFSETFPRFEFLNHSPRWLPKVTF